MEVSEECKPAAIAGHNLITLGQEGTGKTTQITNIRSYLTRMSKNAAMTANTGIASCLLFGGQIIHSWAGIGDGRFSAQHIVSELHYNDAKNATEDMPGNVE